MRNVHYMLQCLHGASPETRLGAGRHLDLVTIEAVDDSFDLAKIKTIVHSLYGDKVKISACSQFISATPDAA